jgi:hypothetical protein
MEPVGTTPLYSGPDLTVTTAVDRVKRRHDGLVERCDGDRSAYTWVFRGTNTGPLEPGDGSSLPATNKRVEVGVSGWATWQGDQLTEITCYWDQLAIFQQLGLA